MMKRILALVLAMLLLAGCTGQMPDETTEATQEQTTAIPTDPGSYVPNHTVEQDTNGDVLAFSPNVDDITSICVMGNNLLILSGEENVNLTLLTGKKGITYATADTTLNLKSEFCSYAATADGFAYYDDVANAVIYLNVKLREDSRLSLPEDISGKPFISASGSVYYAVDNQIREVSPETQIPRMIKQVAGTNLQIMQFAFDGDVLGCTYMDNHNFEKSLYVSGKTGETLRECELLLTLDTWQDTYFATRMDGVIKQQITGTLDTTARSVNQTVFSPILAVNGVLFTSQAEDVQTVSVCDLASGKITAQLPLAGQKVLQSVASSDAIWLLVADEQDDKMLYKWTGFDASADTETVYVGTLYNAQNPNIEALAACQKRVDDLNRQYNVKIRIWQEGVKVQEEHILIAEHQPEAISAMLDRVEEALKMLPEGFMRKTGDRNTVRICIVRQIDDGKPAISFWDEDGDIFLVFAIDSVFEEQFPVILGYPVVSHILGNSVEMDYWTRNNPADFSYGTINSAYVEGENRYFADVESMESVTDDRSRIFGYALMPGNQEMFKSKPMQEKLKLLCEAIRDAYRLTRYKEILPWEQYLETPIAPQ